MKIFWTGLCALLLSSAGCNQGAYQQEERQEETQEMEEAIREAESANGDLGE